MALDERDTAVESKPGATADSPGNPEDSSYGMVMFLTFSGAVLTVTFAVCVLALVGSWWMMGIAVAVHVIVTAAVLAVVLRAFSWGGGAGHPA